MATRGRYNYALLTNKSGADVDQGMTLIPDSANDLAFKTSTTSGDLRVFASVADELIADDALGLVQLHGSIVEALLTSATVVRGHYIKQGTVAGKVIDTSTMADASTSPPVGSIGIAMTGVTGAGAIAAFIFPAQPDPGSGGVTDFTDLGDVPASYTGQGDKIVTVKTDESGLEFTTPGAAANITETYNPDLPPTSPEAANDEFNAGSISGSWTAFGSPDVSNVTDYHGYYHCAKTGSSVTSGIYETFAPGAAAFTVAAKVSGNVLQAGSNQVLIALADSSGSFIVDFGMLNGKDAIVGAGALSGGFDDYAFDGSRGSGTTYWLCKRDASTNYIVYMSRDGINWIQLASFSQAGTIGRIELCVAAFSGSKTEAYYDFVRAFTSQTERIGNDP